MKRIEELEVLIRQLTTDLLLSRDAYGTCSDEFDRVLDDLNTVHKEFLGLRTSIINNQAKGQF